MKTFNEIINEFKSKYTQSDCYISYSFINMEGKEVNISLIKISDLVDDWFKDCIHCPENDREIYNIYLKGKGEFYTFHHPILFGKVMEKLITINKIYLLPITYSVSGFIEIGANSIEEAINIFKEKNKNHKLPLVKECKYIDESSHLNIDESVLIEFYNKYL